MRSDSIFFAEDMGGWLKKVELKTSEASVSSSPGSDGRPSSIFEQEQRHIQKLFGKNIQKTKSPREKHDKRHNYQSNTWNCSSCTFMNSTASCKCEVCHKVDPVRQRLFLQESKEADARELKHALEQHQKSQYLNDVWELYSSDEEEGMSSSRSKTNSEHSNDHIRAASGEASNCWGDNQELYTVQTFVFDDAVCHINKLSERELVHIFSFVANIQALTSMRAVKRTWTTITEDCSLWKPLFVELRTDGRINSFYSDTKKLKYKYVFAPISDRVTDNVPASEDSLASAFVEVARAGVCSVCCLIQARSSSTHCEFCDTELPLQQSTTPIPPTNSKQAYTCVKAEELQPLEELQNELWKYASGQNGLDAVRFADKSGQWHYLVKQAVLDSTTFRKWVDESIQMAWVWLQQGLRNSLRDRLHHGRIDPATALGEQNVPVHQKPTVRAINKMLNNKWQLLYESLCCELALQSEALCCDTLRILGPVDEIQLRPNHSLSVLLEAWRAFDDWVNFWDDYCGSLNDRIAYERYQKSQLEDDCKGELFTPYFRETALLAFRNEFLLRFPMLDLVLKIMHQFSQPSLGKAQLTHRFQTADYFTNDELTEDEILYFSVHESAKDCQLTESSSYQKQSFKPPCKRTKLSSTFEKQVMGGYHFDTINATTTEGNECIEKLQLELFNMIQVLDVPDDRLNKHSKTQGIFRRMVLIPMQVFYKTDTGKGRKESNPQNLQDEFTYHPDMYADIGKQKPHRHSRKDWEKFKKEFFK